MLGLVLFNLLYIATCTYALVRGGAPERSCALILILDFQLSHWLLPPIDQRYRGVELQILAVDALAFAALYGISIFTTRFWPMWAAAMQGLVVIGHLSILLPTMLPFVYGASVQKWAWALLILLAIATRRHQVRLARSGIDPAWTLNALGQARHERPHGH